jgi:hypothetical protein
MRAHGCGDLLVHCNSGRCNHSTTMNVGHLADDTEIAALGFALVCHRCGYVGARVTANWPSDPSISRRSGRWAIQLGDLNDGVPTSPARKRATAAIKHAASA